MDYKVIKNKFAMYCIVVYFTEARTETVKTLH